MNYCATLSNCFIRILLLLFIAFCLIGNTPILSQAQIERYELLPNLTFDGSLRLRGEWKDDFHFQSGLPGNDENYLLTQLRLNLLWQPTDRVEVFVEGQDARIFFENDINDDAVPNIFADEFELHQGYVDLKHEFADHPFRLRIGRQKFNFGTKRLVASLEWVNTARVWDGVLATYGDSSEWTIDAFASRLVAPDRNSFNDWAYTGSRLFDSSLHGIYYTNKTLIPDTQLEAYWLYRLNDNAGDDIHTLGSRFAHKQDAWDFDGEAAVQFGDQTTAGTEFDHLAFMLHVGGGYTFEEYSNTRVGAAYNFASGDDDPTDGDHNTFDNLYPLNHAYYGYMDFFALQNLHNIELTVEATFIDKLKARVAYQGFWLAEEDDDAWYNAGAGVIRNAGGANVDPYVGSEIDITLTYPFNKHVNAQLGYGHFFTGSYVSDTGPSEDADFVYLQTRISF